MTPRKNLVAMAFGMALLGTAAYATDAVKAPNTTPEQLKAAVQQQHESAYSTEAFAAAQASGKPFFVAFHKKGCSTCVAQKKAFQGVYTDPVHAGLKVLIVDYDNDTASLQKFGVGQQSTLILFTGDREISRSAGVTSISGIQGQLNTKG